MDNALYYGDNLKILRDHIKDESIDLVYLDPPSGYILVNTVCIRSDKGDRRMSKDTMLVVAAVIWVAVSTLLIIGGLTIWESSALVLTGVILLGAGFVLGGIYANMTK